MKKRKTPPVANPPDQSKNKPPPQEPDTPGVRAALKRLNQVELNAAKLAEQAESTQDAKIVAQLVEQLEQAVDIAPRESYRHGMAVINLCNSLGVLYQKTGDRAALQRGAEVAKHWLDLLPPNDWRSPLYLVALWKLAYHLALATGKESDQSEAISLIEDGLGALTTGDGVYCIAACMLCELYLNRFRTSRSPTDLDATINVASEVLTAPGASRRQLQDCYNWSAQALVYRYELLHGVPDLDLAIKLVETALADNLNPKQTVDFYAVMGMALRYRFNLIGALNDLEQSLGYWEILIQNSASAEQRAVAAANYATGLVDHYHYAQEKNLEDLNNAVSASAAALKLLPVGSTKVLAILASFANSLLERYKVTKDSIDLTLARNVLSTGLDSSAYDIGVMPRLHILLAKATLYLAANSPSPNDLVREAVDHFAQAREMTGSYNQPLLTTALLDRESRLVSVDMEVAALLWQSELDPAGAPKWLRRALVIGEAAKSWALATDMLRRPLFQPADVPKELFEREALWLAQLSLLENEELLGVSWSDLVEHADLRKEMQRQLMLVYAEITASSDSGARYVRLRQSPEHAWLDSIGQRNPTTGYLSFLSIRDVRGGNEFEYEGIAVLGVAPGDTNPFVLARNPHMGSLSNIARQFEAEVPGDSGLGKRRETWHTALKVLVGDETPARLKQALTVIVSPPRDGHNLPWNLVLQKAGYRAEGDSWLPVVTLPSFVLITPRSLDKQDNTELNALPKRIIALKPKSVEDTIKQLEQTSSWSGPLIVGNPTSDLPAAETEARNIAAILDVTPLIGSEVLIETVRAALYQAPVIHLAAHAWFDETDELESAIFVADGTIPAKELIGIYNQAELVVLSSCEGGVANRVIGGEVAGLAHALLRTGARTIVAALWPVDDDATAFLMTEFYRARLKGTDDATALVQAMRVTSEQPLWNHPYFWSGFVLMQGEL